jgi:hypothetical protein
MVFPMGSIFIFGSWVCEADDKGSLHGHLIETLETHEDLTLSTKLAEDLAEKLTVPESTRAPITVNLDLTSESDSPSESYPGPFKNNPSPFPIRLQNMTSTLQEINSDLLQVSSKKLSHFPTGLNNMAKTYQGLLRNMAGQARRLYLTRAHKRSCISHNI